MTKSECIDKIKSFRSDDDIEDLFDKIVTILDYLKFNGDEDIVNAFEENNEFRIRKYNK